VIMFLSRWFEVQRLLADPEADRWAAMVSPSGHVAAGASILHLLAHRGGNHCKSAWYGALVATLMQKVRCMVAWLPGWLVAGRLVAWLVGCLVGWLAGWLYGCLVAWLVVAGRSRLPSLVIGIV
jgi:hypothetical protein